MIPQGEKGILQEGRQGVLTAKTDAQKKQDAKSILMNLHELTENAEDCILSLQTAFLYNRLSPLTGCNVIIEDIKKAESTLTGKITSLVADHPDLRSYVSLPGHLLVIGENLEKLVELIGTKIRENILFSDKAAKETIFLLQRLIEILWTVSSLILARNTFLGMYIDESIVNLSKTADEYATLHEERLIEGLCLPKASSVYVNMLDSIKSIAWHIREIARHLTS